MRPSGQATCSTRRLGKAWESRYSECPGGCRNWRVALWQPRRESRLSTPSAVRKSWPGPSALDALGLGPQEYGIRHQPLRQPSYLGLRRPLPLTLRQSLGLRLRARCHSNFAKSDWNACFLLKNDLKGTFFPKPHQNLFSENKKEPTIICMGKMGGKGPGGYMIEVVFMSYGQSLNTAPKVKSLLLTMHGICSWA
jgi:hypothetical protein